MTYCIDSIGCTGNVMTCKSCQAPGPLGVRWSDKTPAEVISDIQALFVGAGSNLEIHMPASVIEKPHLKMSAGKWIVTNITNHVCSMRPELYHLAYYWVRRRNFA